MLGFKDRNHFSVLQKNNDSINASWEITNSPAGVSETKTNVLTYFIVYETTMAMGVVTFNNILYIMKLTQKTIHTTRQ